MIKVVSWNIAKRKQPWRELVEMGADVALLQEAGEPPSDLDPTIDLRSQAPWEPWEESSYDRWTVVVQLSDRVKVE